MAFLSRILAKIGGRQAQQAQRHSGKVGSGRPGDNQSESFFSGAPGEAPSRLRPDNTPPGDSGIEGPAAGSPGDDRSS